MSALNYTVGTSSRVDVPDQSALNDLLTFSILAWVNPTSLANRRIVQKGRVGVAPKGIKSLEINSSGALTINVGRNGDTTSAIYASNTAPLAKTTHPYCVLATFDQNGAGQLGHIYTGDATTPLTEVTYGSNSAGSGAFDVEATGDNWVVGNSHNNNVAFPGIFYSLILWNRVYTLSDYQREARRWLAMGNAGVMFRYRLGSNGTGPVLDESGNGRHGTLTTAVPTADVVPGFSVRRRKVA